MRPLLRRHAGGRPPGRPVGEVGDSGGPSAEMEVAGTAPDNLYGENWSQIATIVTS